MYPDERWKQTRFWANLRMFLTTILCEKGMAGASGISYVQGNSKTSLAYKKKVKDGI